jgi:D-xylose transport system permease protein
VPEPGPRTVPIRELAYGRWIAIKSGDVGSLPVIFALILITIVFTKINSNFLTAGNFVNIIVQMAGFTAIGIGVVFVLLLGEIDLSIGYVAGIGGVVVAELQQPDGSWQIKGVIAIVISILICALIGAFQGSFVALIGVPSFVVTLAGLLFWQGVILKVIGIQGVIVIQDNTINNVANYYFSAQWAWILGLATIAGYALVILVGVAGRRRHGIFSDNLVLVAVRIAGVAAVTIAVVVTCNNATDQGLPFAGVFIVALLVFWTFIAKRTVFGRHVYAVGGNAEAARRAGINVARIRIVVFMIMGAMAAVGGVILAARLRSVDLNAGGGTLLLDAIAAAVIGGASLFGGRGEVKAAVLGALVIASLENGSDLAGWSAGTKFMIVGAFLLAAVTLDTVLRRRQTRSGR